MNTQLRRSLLFLAFMVTLMVSVTTVSVNVFAASPRDSGDGGGASSYTQTTYHNAYDHSAMFTSTIEYTNGKWTGAGNRYGTATLFNLDRNYGETDAGMTQWFKYSGMGQYNNLFTQVNNIMRHYY